MLILTRTDTVSALSTITRHQIHSGQIAALSGTQLLLGRHTSVNASADFRMSIERATHCLLQRLRMSGGRDGEKQGKHQGERLHDDGFRKLGE